MWLLLPLQPGSVLDCTTPRGLSVNDPNTMNDFTPANGAKSVSFKLSSHSDLLNLNQYQYQYLNKTAVENR